VWASEDVCWSFGDDLCDDVRGGTETAGELLADDCRGARGVVMLETGDGSWSAGVLGEEAALLWRVEFLRVDEG
jgi:hypothetical protein